MAVCWANSDTIDSVASVELSSVMMISEGDRDWFARLCRSGVKYFAPLHVASTTDVSSGFPFGSSASGQACALFFEKAKVHPLR